MSSNAGTVASAKRQLNGYVWTSLCRQGLSDIDESHLGIQWSTDFGRDEEDVGRRSFRLVDAPLDEQTTDSLTLARDLHSEDVQICWAACCQRSHSGDLVGT